MQPDKAMAAFGSQANYSLIDNSGCRNAKRNVDEDVWEKLTSILADIWSLVTKICRIPKDLIKHGMDEYNSVTKLFCGLIENATKQWE